MTDLPDPSSYAAALDALDPAVLAARLEVARVRNFDKRAAAIAALDKLLESRGEEGAIAARSYHSHEAGERRPKMSRLIIYVKLFDIPIDYLLFGKGGEVYEAEARQLFKRAGGGGQLKIDRLEKHPTARKLVALANSTADSSINSAPVNQEQALVKIEASHNPPQRFIVILPASEIRKLRTGRGGAAVFGPKMPVPDFLDASRHSYGYRIPAHDASMAMQSGLSFNPGSIIFFDLDRQILPGDYVIANIRGYEEPVVRQYVANRPYAAGSAFELHALNPSYKQIEVTDKADCLFIGRIIFFGNQL